MSTTPDTLYISKNPGIKAVDPEMCSKVNAADSNASNSVTASRNDPFASMDGAGAWVASGPQPPAIAAEISNAATAVIRQRRRGRRAALIFVGQNPLIIVRWSLGFAQFHDQKAKVPPAISKGGFSPVASSTNIRSLVADCPLPGLEAPSVVPATTRWVPSGDHGELE